MSSVENGDAEETEKKNKTTLFDYTEAELLEEGVLTHYEILNLDPFAGQEQVKKSYRKASLKYHPDKTGRGDDDYVFLAVKAAHDTLIDHTKRQAYDSTVLPFDESIPLPRSTLLQDSMLLYKDDDFYETFGPVFARNLRFDAKLRPDAVKKKSLSSSTGSSSNKNGNNAPKKGHKAPELGNADTPMAQVHAFYEYWIHFDSWRDFSAQAADELQVENQLENAESRFEKRWIQKEIDKRAKQLKTKENGRIQTLVERAMEADPRLRQERLQQVQAKERQKAERAAEKERQAQAKKDQQAAQQQAAEEEAKQRALEKERREQEKKLMRKARQQFRRVTSAAYESLSSSSVWADSYDMSVDIDLICSSLCDDLEQLQELTLQFESMSKQNNSPNAALKMIHERAAKERKSAANNSKSYRSMASSSSLPDANGDTAASASPSNNNNSNDPWTKEELSALAKGVKKYPPGGSSRWDQITLFCANLCKRDSPRTKEECIAKYNEVARSAVNASSGSVKSTAASTAASTAVDKPAATAAASPSSSSPKAASNGAASSPAAAPATTASINDWTTEQDQQLQTALAKFPATMEKNARWTAIAGAVTDKSKKQCVQRFKVIREALQKKK